MIWKARNQRLREYARLQSVGAHCVVLCCVVLGCFWDKARQGKAGLVGGGLTG